MLNYPTAADCCSENAPGRPCSCKACLVHGHGDHDRLRRELASANHENSNSSRKHRKVDP